MEQMTLFDGRLTDVCEVKPEIGSRLVFIYEGKEYPCEVIDHCGYDFFYVRFTGRAPEDDDEQLAKTGGFHLSLRGFKEHWRFE